MLRRSFLKGLLALGVGLLIPLPKQEPVPVWDAHAGTNKGELFGYKTLNYKGRSHFEAGYVYCPYIPLTIVKAKNYE